MWSTRYTAVRGYYADPLTLLLQTSSKSRNTWKNIIPTLTDTISVALASPTPSCTPHARGTKKNVPYTAFSTKSQEQTCAPAAEKPIAAAGFHGVVGPSALFGTGPSYTDVVSETEGGGGEEGEGKKSKKKKSGGDKEKVRGPLADMQLLFTSHHHILRNLVVWTSASKLELKELVIHLRWVDQNLYTKTFCKSKWYLRTKVETHARSK